MRLFVRDANGTSVPNARVKVWAGPPPSGSPPYFNDDYPYRLTNSSGMLEYLALVGRMPDTRDYWMQVLNNEGGPQSDAVQFHFPQGSTIWITATVQAAEGEPPPDPLRPPEGVEWDSRLTAMRVSIAPVVGLAPGQSYWKIVSAQYEDEKQSGGDHTFYYTVLDQSGAPIQGVQIQMDFQGRDPRDVPTPVYTDPFGCANYGLYAGPVGWDPSRFIGPYTAWVGDPDLRGNNPTGILGEKLVGVGLPMNRHVCFLVTWRKTIVGGPPALGSISGAILNAPSGTQVTLTSDKLTLMTAPDADGRYAFKQLTAGTYSISITGAGVVASNVALDGTATSTAKVDYVFPIAPPKRESRVEWVIENAPPDLKVVLSSSSEALTTTVGPSGAFQFTNLAAGTYSLAISGVGVVNPNISLDGINTVTSNYAIPVQSNGKVISHYLLFGSPGLSATRTNLILALDYITRFAPVVGFSIDEARCAENVTVVGAGVIGTPDEQVLTKAGCKVRHIAGVDSYAMDQLFGKLISSGNPYPSD
jgi:hypothetical protein